MLDKTSFVLTFFFHYFLLFFYFIIIFFIEKMTPLALVGHGIIITHHLYAFFQNGYHFNILLLVFKLALLTSFSISKMKRIFHLEQGKDGQFECKQNNIKMAAIME